MVLSRCRRLAVRAPGVLISGMDWRAFAVLMLVAATAGWHEAGYAADADPAVVFQGAIPLPNRAEDADGNAVEITGLSGVAWLGDDRYVASTCCCFGCRSRRRESRSPSNRFVS